MQIIQVEILSDQGLKQLKQLEKLNVLKLLRSEKKKDLPKRKWSGSISKETAEKMLAEIEKERGEWERNT